MASNWRILYIRQLRAAGYSEVVIATEEPAAVHADMKAQTPRKCDPPLLV
jgi:hypothetical protein